MNVHRWDSQLVFGWSKIISLGGPAGVDVGGQVMHSAGSLTRVAEAESLFAAPRERVHRDRMDNKAKRLGDRTEL